MVSPLLRLPKLVGDLKDIRLVSAGVARNLGASISEETAVDSELRVHVNVHNKHPQPAYLKRWELEIRPKRGRTFSLPSFVPEKDRRWRINGPLMPEQLHFALGEPHEGWLYFRCPNTMAARLEGCELSLFAVDTDNRKHRLFIGLIPKAGSGTIEKNAVEEHE